MFDSPGKLFVRKLDAVCIDALQNSQGGDKVLSLVSKLNAKISEVIDGTIIKLDRKTDMQLINFLTGMKNAIPKKASVKQIELNKKFDSEQRGKSQKERYGYVFKNMCDFVQYDLMPPYYQTLLALEKSSPLPSAAFQSA